MYRFRVVGQGGAWEHVQGLGWRKKKGESMEKKYAAFDPSQAPSLLSVFFDIYENLPSLYTEVPISESCHIQSIISYSSTLTKSTLKMGL
jgi:hypothetical protein